MLPVPSVIENPYFMRPHATLFRLGHRHGAGDGSADHGVVALMESSMAYNTDFFLTLFYHGLFYGESLHLLWQATSMFFLFFLCFSK